MGIDMYPIGEDMRLITIYHDDRPVIFHKEALRRSGRVNTSDLDKYHLLNPLIMNSYIIVEYFSDMDLSDRGKGMAIFVSCLN